jgi:hypothetical protein
MIIDVFAKYSIGTMEQNKYRGIGTIRRFLKTTQMTDKTT